MNYKVFSGLLLIACVFISYKGSSQATDSMRTTNSSGIIVEGAKPQLISKQFKFTEGPAVDKDGNVFFTDQPNDKIWKYGTDGKLSVFLDKTGRSNGLYFNKSGNLVACADENNQLISIDKKGKITILISDYKGLKLNGPNDLWIHPDGHIYLTDPYYQRNYWTRQKPDIEGQRVYYLPKGKKELIIVDSTIQKPNGIIGTANSEWLYVADTQGNKTYKYKINKGGLLGSPQLFVEQGSDGMTIDNKGNIYLTGNGVTVYSKEGKKIEHIAIPEPWTANVCFGGKNRDKLFITASTAVYILDTNVKGVQ